MTDTWARLIARAYVNWRLKKAQDSLAAAIEEFVRSPTPESTEAYLRAVRHGYRLFRTTFQLPRDWDTSEAVQGEEEEIT